MTYSPITPQSQPSPAATQAQIQTNFAQYALKFLVNHSALNSKTQGDHEKVVIEKLVGDPGVIQDQVSLFSKDAGSNFGGTQPQLFAQIKKFLPTPNDPTIAPNVGMQLTQSIVNTVGPNQFQSFLPGNYMLYFGTVTANGTVTLVPAPTVIHVALAIPNNLISPGSFPNKAFTKITSNSTFDINSTSTGVFTIMWVAIATA